MREVGVLAMRSGLLISLEKMVGLIVGTYRVRDVLGHVPTRFMRLLCV